MIPTPNKNLFSLCNFRNPRSHSVTPRQYPTTPSIMCLYFDSQRPISGRRKKTHQKVGTALAQIVFANSVGVISSLPSAPLYMKRLRLIKRLSSYGKVAFPLIIGNSTATCGASQFVYKAQNIPGISGQQSSPAASIYSTCLLLKCFQDNLRPNLSKTLSSTSWLSVSDKRTNVVKVLYNLVQCRSPFYVP